ncbi:MAG: threonine synthase, partial [Clostridia bacterium]|nr:threonine synthase [Clostridia bacterium]
MNYISTRGLSPAVTAEEAMINGLAPDGGLYLPETVPVLTEEEKRRLQEADYEETALLILRKYLSESAFPDGKMKEAVRDAYRSFDGPEPVRLVPLGEDLHALELWHGPTSAFKDMALQLFPRILFIGKASAGNTEENWILTATSGDTGKAALEGFRDVPGMRVFVFYPHNGVSRVQELQMATQEGENVFVCAVEGNFDDTQTGVKKLFSDPALREKLGRRGIRLSSANSINWGRLLPQIVYYAWAAARVSGSSGTPVDFVVPTGNFGNILAGELARRMGCPVGKLVCASNANRVLTDFFTTGIYDRRRLFRRTTSPSMDILISSNLERLLFLESGDHFAVRGWMGDLAEKGWYRIPDSLKDRLSGRFLCGSADDGEAAEAVREARDRFRWTADPHTAVGFSVLEKLRRSGSLECCPAVLVSTASPYKFAPDVLKALTGRDETVFRAMDELERLTGDRRPAALKALREKRIRFESVCRPEEMASVLTI